MPPKKSKPKRKPTEVFSVVGIQYRATLPMRRELELHVPFQIKLKREPRNPADPNAIAVVINDDAVPHYPMKIGYLRKGVAAVLAPKIDKGSVTVEKAVLVQLDSIEADGIAEIWLKHKGK